MVGLFIEMIGILTLAMGGREGGRALIGLSSEASTRLAWAAVGIGFVVWLTGNILAYWPQGPRAPSKPPGGTEDDWDHGPTV